MTDQNVTQELLVMRESKAFLHKTARRWLSNYKVIDGQSHQPLLLIRKAVGEPYRIIDPAEDRLLFTLKAKFNLFRYQFLLEDSDKNVRGRIEAPIWRWRYHIRLTTDASQECQYYSNDPEGILKDANGKIVMKLLNQLPRVDPKLCAETDLTWMEHYLLQLFQREQTLARAEDFNNMELLAIASLPLRSKWQKKR